MKPSVERNPDLRLLPWWRRWASAWGGFWFSPADPTLLGLMRVCCGIITLYTMIVYSFTLQDFMGEHAWYDLQTRYDDVVQNKPVLAGPLSGRAAPAAGRPVNDSEQKYLETYRRVWKDDPPPPYPVTNDEVMMADRFRQTYGIDMRTYGLRFPRTQEELKYLEEYAVKYRVPPPAYPASAQEKQEIDDYLQRHGVDPRRLYAKGTPVWSLWFHITDPAAMAWIHAGVCLIVFLFTIGFATRVTSVLTWITCLWYIHRNTVCLFGVDTMMTILLLYLMIGPSGAAVSVDRLIARWWSRSKLSVINRWRALFGRPALTQDQIHPATYQPVPPPLVSANVAVRLVQIHVCIIYFVAGLAKLQGAAWWNGTAVWGTLANYEFAPMQFEIYNAFFRVLGENQLFFELFITGAGWFTLAFEITYLFIVWRPSTRWWALSGAILLHGFIGLFMGLKTFSFMMLVMNMAFLTHAEALWALAKLGVRRPASAKATPAPEPMPKPTRANLEPSLAGSAHVTAKK